MKFVAPMSLVLATSLFVVACSGSSRPAGKPSAGPPPEYEAPRSFDLPKAPAAEPPATAPAPLPAEQPAPAAPSP